MQLTGLFTRRAGFWPAPRILRNLLFRLFFYYFLRF